ncbi:MAG: PrsW family intramembrane metalloprotease [Flavobacteriales bacterium]|nr:PrsW family intramembrane metalloprotease [Flavobacteriales bacterium]
MIFIYGFIALWISWVWVDYFRLIDIYEREHLKYALLIFLLGAASVFVVFGINDLVFGSISFVLNGQLINDYLYYSIKVGAVEELAKFLPFVIFYVLFKKQLNEPIDYLFYGCTSALGFAAVENTLYFYSNGASIINGRAILSTLGHMMWTGMICYGVVRYKYLHKKTAFLAIPGYFLLAAFGHGFFNFWLAFEPFQGKGWLVTIAYFLISISLFVGMLNNAINNSAFFTYHKVIHASHVARRLFIHFGIVFLVQFAVLAYTTSVVEAIVDLHAQIYFPGFIVMIRKKGVSRIGVQGSPFDDVLARGYFQKNVKLYPLSKRRTAIKSVRDVYIASKHFLSEDEPAYRAEIRSGEKIEPNNRVLLVAKSKGVAYRGKYPIVGIYRILEPFDPKEARQPDDNFSFLEWGYVVKDEAESNERNGS